jgi:hypothetical protein
MIVNKQIFIEKLETADWITLLCPFDDVDEMCNQFTKIFLELARKCISNRTITVRSNVKLWFTSEIGEYIIETRIYVYIINRETRSIIFFKSQKKN